MMRVQTVYVVIMNSLLDERSTIYGIYIAKDDAELIQLDLRVAYPQNTTEVQAWQVIPPSSAE